jgi:hypothetical protein
MTALGSVLRHPVLSRVRGTRALPGAGRTQRRRRLSRPTTTSWLPSVGDLPIGKPRRSARSGALRKVIALLPGARRRTARRATAALPGARLRRPATTGHLPALRASRGDGSRRPGRSTPVKASRDVTRERGGRTAPASSSPELIRKMAAGAAVVSGVVAHLPDGSAGSSRGPARSGRAGLALLTVAAGVAVKNREKLSSMLERDGAASHDVSSPGQGW